MYAVLLYAGNKILCLMSYVLLLKMISYRYFCSFQAVCFPHYYQVNWPDLNTLLYAKLHNIIFWDTFNRQSYEGSFCNAN